MRENSKFFEAGSTKKFGPSKDTPGDVASERKGCFLQVVDWVDPAISKPLCDVETKIPRGILRGSGGICDKSLIACPLEEREAKERQRKEKTK